MMKEDSESDDVVRLAGAMQWASRITTIALEMALPPLGGYWLDNKTGYFPLFISLGAILGFSTGLWHLLLLANSLKNKTLNKKNHL